MHLGKHSFIVRSHAKIRRRRGGRAVASSGLRKSFWLGNKSNSKDILLPERKLNWVTDEPFLVLGITFCTELSKIPELNYNKKSEEIRQLLDCWTWRHLSILGKIQVIKSLAVPKLVHLLTSLHSPTNNSFCQIETIFYSFIWGNKRDKIARKILINTIVNGGLKMIDIHTFDKALKISWVKKIWDEKLSCRLKESIRVSYWILERRLIIR